MASRDPERYFDLRTIKRHLKRGLVAEGEFERFLEGLPDVTDKIKPQDEGGDDDGFDGRGRPKPSTPVSALLAGLRRDVSYDDDDDDDDDDDIDDDDDDDTEAVRSEPAPVSAAPVAAAPVAAAPVIAPAPAPVEAAPEQAPAGEASSPSAAVPSDADGAEPTDGDGEP